MRAIVTLPKTIPATALHVGQWRELSRLPYWGKNGEPKNRSMVHYATRCRNSTRHHKQVLQHFPQLQHG